MNYKDPVQKNVQYVPPVKDVLDAVKRASHVADGSFYAENRPNGTSWIDAARLENRYNDLSQLYGFIADSLQKGVETNANEYSAEVVDTVKRELESIDALVSSNSTLQKHKRRLELANEGDVTITDRQQSYSNAVLNAYTSQASHQSALHEMLQSYVPTDSNTKESAQGASKTEAIKTGQDYNPPFAISSLIPDTDVGETNRGYDTSPSSSHVSSETSYLGSSSSRKISLRDRISRGVNIAMAGIIGMASIGFVPSSTGNIYQTSTPMVQYADADSSDCVRMVPGLRSLDFSGITPENSVVGSEKDKHYEDKQYDAKKDDKSEAYDSKESVLKGDNVVVSLDADIDDSTVFDFNGVPRTGFDFDNFLHDRTSDTTHHDKDKQDISLEDVVVADGVKKVDSSEKSYVSHEKEVSVTDDNGVAYGNKKDVFSRESGRGYASAMVCLPIYVPSASVNGDTKERVKTDVGEEIYVDTEGQPSHRYTLDDVNTLVGSGAYRAMIHDAPLFDIGTRSFLSYSNLDRSELKERGVALEDMVLIASDKQTYKVTPAVQGDVGEGTTTIYLRHGSENGTLLAQYNPVENTWEAMEGVEIKEPRVQRARGPSSRNRGARARQHLPQFTQIFVDGNPVAEYAGSQMRLLYPEFETDDSGREYFHRGYDPTQFQFVGVQTLDDEIKNMRVKNIQVESKSNNARAFALGVGAGVVVPGLAIPGAIASIADAAVYDKGKTNEGAHEQSLAIEQELSDLITGTHDFTDRDDALLTVLSEYKKGFFSDTNYSSEFGNPEIVYPVTADAKQKLFVEAVLREREGIKTELYALSNERLRALIPRFAKNSLEYATENHTLEDVNINGERFNFSYTLPERVRGEPAGLFGSRAVFSYWPSAAENQNLINILAVYRDEKTDEVVGSEFLSSFYANINDNWLQFFSAGLGAGALLKNAVSSTSAPKVDPKPKPEYPNIPDLTITLPPGEGLPVIPPPTIPTPPVPPVVTPTPVPTPPAPVPPVTPPTPPPGG
ncbi:MAG: hypothetical protein ACMXYE_02115 [Candidatus Woesearchaeota archaeon]